MKPDLSILLSRWNDAIEDRYLSKVDMRGPDECWPWLGFHSQSARGVFKVKGVIYVAARVALLRDRGIPPEPHLMALHSCDNPVCVNPSHLRWGTYKDNFADAMTRNRLHRWNGERKGERNPCAKLTAAKVAEIRKLDLPPSVIAKIYGVTPSAITNIRSGKAWTNG